MAAPMSHEYDEMCASLGMGRTDLLMQAPFDM